MLVTNVQYITAPQDRPGFENFFGGWLVKPHEGQSGPVYLIDVGTAAPAAEFVAALKRTGLKRLDYVLLSHIHVDHAGALAEVLEAYPEALAVAHQKGLKHLANPDHLWKSTREVMGELAPMYGRPTPVDPARLRPHSQADLEGLVILETPGHAPHHLSFIVGGYMFVGEAGGTPYQYGGQFYSRPATPPRFFPEVTLQSLETLRSLPNMPAFFGHSDQILYSRPVISRYEDQLKFWLDYLKPLARPRDGETRLEHLEHLAGKLLTDDPELKPLNFLAGQDLWREKFFLRNSIQGVVEYLNRESASA